MHLVVTACTNRKTVAPAPTLRAANLASGALEDVASDWLARLKVVSRDIRADQLYSGRSFQEATIAAAALNAKLCFVSAGLGLVTSDTIVPPYALSVVGGSKDNVLTRIEQRPSAVIWWQTLRSASPFSTSMASAVAAISGIVVVALSENYLAMVAEDLKQLDPEDRSRIRIVTRASVARIDPALRPYLMPYDDRLDGPDSPIRGTRGDFTARAARHFAEYVAAPSPTGSLDEHAGSVANKLQNWRTPPVFERVRHNDDALLGIIRANWERAGGQSTKLLRVLRDDLNIACEQRRFVGLMRRARTERQVAA